MANNRLFLVDDESGDVLYFAKASMAGATATSGWSLVEGVEIDDFIAAHDFAGGCGGRTKLRLADEHDAAVVAKWRADSTPPAEPAPG